MLFGVFGRWRFLGWHGREQATLSFRAPGRRGAHPGPARLRVVLLRDGGAVPASRRSSAPPSSTTARSSTASSASTSRRSFPYNLMRTWHVQLALFWVATSFVAAGIFLAPMIARREPRGQGKLAFALLGALAVVVFGTLIGSYLGDPRRARGRGVELVRAAGLRVPRPRAASGRCC